MIKKVVLLVPLFALAFSTGLFLQPSTAYAQTAKAAEACRKKWQPHSYEASDPRLDTFAASDCADEQDGNCYSYVTRAESPDKYPITKIKCGSAGSNKQYYEDKNKESGDGDNASSGTDVGISSSNCTVANNVCVSGLPRTNTGAGWVRNILNFVTGIIAAISLLFVVIGGMRYVFSQGDPQGVSKAKSTIIYALIGLVVALMAQGLVALVVKVVL